MCTMGTNLSLPKKPPAVNFREFLRIARWVLRVTWSTNAHLVIGLIATTLLPGLTPAVLALAARGLVNALIKALDNGTQDISSLLPWLVLGLVSTVLETISQIANAYFSRCLDDELNIRVTSDILEHAADLDVAFFEDPRCQDMMMRARRNIAHNFNRFVSNCLSVWTDVIQVASLVGILTAIEPLITLVLLPLAVPYLILQWRLARRRHDQEYNRAVKHRWVHYFVTRVTDPKWAAEVKLLGLASVFIDRFRALMTEFRDQDRQLYRYTFLFNSLFVILVVTTLYVVLTRVAGHVLGGILTVGDVAIYTGATMRLRAALQNIIDLIVTTREDMLYISTLDEFLHVEPQIVQSVGLQSGVHSSAIQFKNVSFTYPGSDRPVLTDVSFCINPGETVALVGENGAGKTTLAKLLARFYDPTEGCIMVGDTDLRELSPAYWHSRIGFVFQRLALYEATAAENIAYGDWETLSQDREQVERIARLANVHDMIKEMPQGYDTFLGRLFAEYTLSQGQWQQMAIARAFARQDAWLLILDEPTSNLDVRAEYELFCRFRELAAGRTTVLISHRFSTVSMADRILVLDEGRIVEQGTHQELLDLDMYYASLYRLHERQMVASPAKAW